MGVWQVGVWSNASSAFTIIAADSTATTPVELDVTYPGYVQQGAYVYYSIYLDTVQFTTNNSSNVVIELLSLDSSDYDLCCDVVLSPMQYGSRWHAHGWHAPASNLIPASQLSSGTLYCGVSGWSDGSYLLSASLASAILLTAGETTTAQSAAGQSQLFSSVLPATATVVTLAVVSDVRHTELYVSGWGQPPGLFNNIDCFDSAGEQSLSLLRPVRRRRLAEHSRLRHGAVPDAGARHQRRPVCASHHS